MTAKKPIVVKKGFVLTKAFVSKLLDIVDKGLVDGLGDPIPGKMCVEAAVCYAMDLPHGDKPTCVAHNLSDIKININDAAFWLSDKMRAKGLRRLAIAQLGSKTVFNTTEFMRLYNTLIMDKYFREYLINFIKSTDLMDITKNILIGNIPDYDDLEKYCDMLDTDFGMCVDNDYFFNSILNISYEEISDIMHSIIRSRKLKEGTPKYRTLVFELCEDIVQILIKMKIPGTKFLYLTK